MQKHHIRIDDLHALMLPELNKYAAGPDNVHFTGAGYGMLGNQVADSILAALAGRQPAATPDNQAPVTNKSLEDLQQDFLKLKFGMFIHFNMETYKNVQWVAGYHSPADFNPGGKIDTDAWADAAVSAGMKYGVLTAKHVSGFCLWDSKYTTYDVMNPACPYQQDLVAQFIKSFTSRGLKVGLYYCWRDPGFGKEFKVLPPECDPATHSLLEQNEFQKKQIAELIEKYPDVFYIWNDGLDPTIMPVEEALAFIRGLGPGILASSNWWDWAKKGTPYADIAVKEMGHFPATNTAPGETCWCLEKSWFWSEGVSPKTASQVVDLLTTANGRNSNFLLNVGPDKQGRFEAASVKVLAEVGKLRKPN
jgi:alpha-L-fucosidase